MWRSLCLAVFTLLSIGLQGQSCGYGPGGIGVFVEDACANGFMTGRPYVVVDLGPGVNDTADLQLAVSYEPNPGNTLVYSTPLVQGVVVRDGIASFELPGFTLPATEQRITITNITLANAMCVQNLFGLDITSDPFDLTVQSQIASVSRDNQNSVDPACASSSTGQLAILVEVANEGTSTNVSPGRLDIQLYPLVNNTNIEIFEPGAPINNNGPRTYLIRTSNNLPVGDYTFLITDNEAGCQVTYDAMVGSTTTDLGVFPLASPVTCFGGNDGGLTVFTNATPSESSVTLFTRPTGTPNYTNRGNFVPNGGNTQFNPISFGGLTAGTYDVLIVANTTGCTAMRTATVGTPPEVVIGTTSAAPVCASEQTFGGSYTVTVTGVTGVSGTVGQDSLYYRFIDGAYDANDQFPIGCFGTPSSSLQDVSLNASGDYELTGFLPSGSFCVPTPQRDTTVRVVLEVRQSQFSSCFDTMSVDLFIQATPATPELETYVIVGSDSLSGTYCSGETFELNVTNAVAEDTYTFARQGALPAGVTAAGAFMDSTAVFTAPISGSFTNTTASQVVITYAVSSVATETGGPAAGCASAQATVSFTVAPEPFVTTIPAARLTDTICNNDSYQSPVIGLNGNTGATPGGVPLAWNYVWDLEAGLTKTGPLSANGLAGGTTTPLEDFTNTELTALDATLTVTPVYVYTNVDENGTVVPDTCSGTPVQIVLTVEPQSNIAVTANGTEAAFGNALVTPTVTICSGSAVTLVTTLATENSRFVVAREDRGVMASTRQVRDGAGNPVAAVTRNLLPADGLTETLTNVGTDPDTLYYTIIGYTYGPNGTDGGGDDCRGRNRVVAVEVLPALTDDAVVDIASVSATTSNGVAFTDGATVCSGTQVGIDLSSSIDNAGTGNGNFFWSRTIDGGTAVTGAVAENGTTAPELTPTLTNLGVTSSTVTWVFRAYTFGPNGTDDGGTGDDCLSSATETLTYVIDPVPQLTLQLNGTTVDSDTVLTICSGEDFLINGLTIVNNSSTGLKYIELDVQNDASFLGLDNNDDGVYPIANFMIGEDDVANNDPDNNFQRAQLVFIPYYEVTDPTTRATTECAGQQITIDVTINPDVPSILGNDQSLTLCSGEAIADSTITGGTSNMATLQTITTGSKEFTATDDEFVVPAGAFAIRELDFTLYGADGGARNGRAGGRGYFLSGRLNGNANTSAATLPVQPGDIIRVKEGDAGDLGAGGDATTLQVVAGSARGNIVAGEILYQYVAAGGGGAGLNTAGADATVQAFTLNASTANGSGGSGVNPATGGQGFPAGSEGGAAGATAGGGGGGYAGGDAGNTLGSTGGQAGTWLAVRSTNLTGTAGLTDAATKNDVNAAERGGQARISYVLISNDVTYTLVSKTAEMGLVEVPGGLTAGATGPDSLLFGEAFVNNTNAPLDVTYTLRPSTAANCASQDVTFDYVVTVRPEATGLIMTGTGSEVTEDAQYAAYSTTICSGDSLSALLTTDIVTETGNNGPVFFFVTDVALSDPGVTFDQTNDDRASNAVFANPDPFGGNNGGRPFPIPFFETAITNLTGAPQTVTYTIRPYIFTTNTNEPNCVGTDFTFTVTVNPGFVNANIVPATTDVCSGESFAEAGFDLSNVYADNLTPAVDSVLLVDYSVTITAAAPNNDPANLDTLSGPDFAGASELKVAVADLENYRFRNRTGARVDIDFDVRLVSADGCTSDVFTLNFDSRAEPIIAAPADGIVTDTVCSEAAIGLVVTPATNSNNAGDFTDINGSIEFYYELTLPDDLELVDGNTLADYPATNNDNEFAMDDELRNRTAGPLVAVYRVAATNTNSNSGCTSDTVTYRVVVEPEPSAGLRLVTSAVDTTLSLDNARAFLTGAAKPNIQICAVDELTVTVVDTATLIAQGPLTANVTITDVDGITGLTTDAMTNQATFIVPVTDLADSISFAMGELMNTTTMAQTFRVRYGTFVPGSGCFASGVVEFDVTVNPANVAVARTEPDGTFSGFAAGQDTLCSGTDFNLRFSAASAGGVNIDSFDITVVAPGLVADDDTPTGTYRVAGGTPSMTNTTNARRFVDYSFTNPTAGVKTATYIVTPISDGCAGVPDTTTVSFRSDIDLTLGDFATVCTSSDALISATDANGSVANPGGYVYRYIGGGAEGFRISEANGTSQAADINQFNNNGQASFTISGVENVRLTFGQGTVNGTAIFEVMYTSTNSCMTTDTLTVTITDVVSAGTLVANPPIVCESDNATVFLDTYLDGETLNGTFLRADGSVVPNGAFVPGTLNSTTGDVEEFTFVYQVGATGSGCNMAQSDSIRVRVQPAANAGTANATDVVACQSAPLVNLFEDVNGLVGAQRGGVFVQINSGVTSVPVDGTTGVFDQDAASEGTYVYEYRVAGANGCPGDEETVVIEVFSQANCPSAVPCDVVNLTAGYNIISFDVIPNDTEIRSVFADEIASENLLRVIGIRPDVDNGMPETFSFIGFDIGSGDNYGGSITDGIQPGYGYIVQVETATSVEVCGAEVADNFNVPLQAGPNYVAYLPDAPAMTDSYFSQLVAAGDLNFVFGIDNGQRRRRTYGALPFDPSQGVGPLTTLRNGQGYILNVDSAYPNANWKSTGLQPTSVFDQFYGAVTDGKYLVGEEFAFTNAAGEVFGRATITTGGYYINASVFGDVAQTEEVEGFRAGDEIFVSYQGEQFATGRTFGGDWDLSRLDLDFNQSLTDTDHDADATVAADLIAYPNPTDGRVTVELTLEAALDGPVTVRVISTLGQLVTERTVRQTVAGVNRLELDLTTVAAGAYRLQVSSAAGLLANRQLIRQ